MKVETYTMRGEDGELSFLINGYVVANAEQFVARLDEYLKEVEACKQRFMMPQKCEAKIMLRGLS
jgi:hypothetical protein